MKQLITILLILISLTSYSQGKYPITVSGSGGGGGAADSSVFATKYFVDTAKSNLRNSIALKMAYTDTAVMLAAYRTKIQTNIDSIAAHNTRIGAVTTSNATKISYTDTATTITTQTFQIQAFDTLGTTPTATYPAGVFTANKVFLGVAYNQAEVVTLWNANSSNQAIGTLKKGSSPFTFTMYPILTTRPTAIYLQPQVQIGTVFYDNFNRGYWGSNWDTSSLASTATWTTLGGGGVKLYKAAAASDFTNIVKYINKGSLTSRNFEIQIDWRPCTLGTSTFGAVIGTYSLRNPAQNCSALAYPDFSTNVGPNFSIGAANSSGVVTSKVNSVTGVPTRSTSNRYSLIMKVMADTISSYLINRNTNEILSLQYFYDFTNTSQTATKPNIFYPSFGEIGQDSIIVYNFRYFNYDNRFVKMTFIGNSITTGYYGGQASLGFPGQLKSKTNYDIQTLAGGYNRTQDVIDNYKEIVDQHPEYAFIEIGTNDRSNSVPQATIRANFDTIYNRLTAAGIKVYWLAAPDAGNPVTAGNDNNYLKTTYPSNFVDTWTGCYGAGQMVDAVHPNAIGFAVLADTIQSKMPSLFPINGQKRQGYNYVTANNVVPNLLQVTSSDSTTTKKISITGNKTNNSGLAVGSMEFQPFALNNAFYTENLYYDIAAGFRYRATGYGHLMQNYNGQILLNGFTTHTANTVASGSDFTTSGKFDYGGTATIGGNITSTNFLYTGGTLVADSLGKVSIGLGVRASARLQLASGTTAASTAPIKLARVAPALNTTAEKYAVEVDSATNGGKIYYTSADAVRNEIQLAAYGELYEDGGSTAITVTTAGTYYQWTTSTVGSSLLCTNSAATDNITVASGGGGTYLVNASVSFVGTNSATQKWAVFKNGSRLTNLTSVVHMAGSALQITTSLTGLVALVATDTIDLRVTSDTNGDTATPAQVNLNITRLSK